MLRACWNYTRKLAGIHFGEYIQKDMIRVRVSKDHRAAIVEMSFISTRVSLALVGSTLVAWGLAMIHGFASRAENGVTGKQAYGSSPI